MSNTDEEPAGVAAPQQRIDIWTTRGLAQALPVRPGQTVLVCGKRQEALVRALGNTGATAVLVTRSSTVDSVPAEVEVRRVGSGVRLPVEQQEAAHVILVNGERDDVSVAASAVQPGGGMLVVAKAGSRSGQVLERVRDDLAAEGVVTTETYGVRQNVKDIRHLVSLQGPALRWYFRAMVLPHNRGRARLSRAGAFLAPPSVLRRRFSAVAVAGQKGPLA